MSASGTTGAAGPRSAAAPAGSGPGQGRPATETLVLRPLEGVAEFRAAERLQQEVWGYDPITVIPLPQLMTAAKFGGLCLGVFDGDRLVAFLYGFVGLKDREPVHISQRLAVLPAYQDRGLGERLKRAQRDRVLAQGLRWVRWTYDPLESRNGYLNLVKLGAHARTYIADYYGPVSGHLNEGLPTDRFEVEWHVRSRRVADALAGRHPIRSPGAPPFAPSSLLTRSEGRPDGLLALREWREPPAGADGVWYVEVPIDIQRTKRADPGLARDWRLASRELFQRLFARGYAASGVLRFEGGARVAYRVEPLSMLDLADADEVRP